MPPCSIEGASLLLPCPPSTACRTAPRFGPPCPYISAFLLDPFHGSAAKDGRQRMVPGNPRLCACRDACSLFLARAPCQARRGRFATAGCRARVGARRCAARRGGTAGDASFRHDSGKIKARMRHLIPGSRPRALVWHGAGRRASCAPGSAALGRPAAAAWRALWSAARVSCVPSFVAGLHGQPGGPRREPGPGKGGDRAAGPAGAGARSAGAHALQGSRRRELRS